ncbi:MAG TPA: rhodanese-like domain-containing protein [Gemmatimonadales bacterium]|nr:rhodanese-like domain-containing protein [Gemmatimonadales bacterium]
MSHLLDAVGDVSNAYELAEGFVTGGQPQAAHLAALKQAGCQVLLDLREAMEERPYRVPDAVTAAGLEYINLPVGHGAQSDETFTKVREQVRSLMGKKSTYCCCNSGNRVGAALLPYLMLDRGMDEDEATMVAMKMGMRNAELMESALEYAHKQTH